MKDTTNLFIQLIRIFTVLKSKYFYNQKELVLVPVRK